MKFEIPEPPMRSALNRRAADLARRIRYFGREGTLLTRLMDKAKRFQQAGDLQSMRLSLETASAMAASFRRGKRSFANSWKSLIDYELALFDIPAAERTAAEALRSGLPESEDAAANVGLIATETLAWRDQIAEAGQSLSRAGGTNRSSGDLLIFLPSPAFGLDIPGEPDFRKGLRFIFGEIVATCREIGISFEVRGRLASHGTPEVEAGRRYVAHHSLGQDGRGLHIKATDRPACFSFDSRGYSGWSDFAATPLDELGLDGLDPMLVAKFFDGEQRIIRGNVSKYNQPMLGKTAAGLPTEYVFVGLQKPGDAVQELAKIPMLGMLSEVARTCKARGMAVVVKRHPKCTSSAVARELKSGVAAGLYQVSDASIHNLIAGSCAVCVVNSSVGAEALLHGKPVYVFGASEYHHVCHRMNAPGDFEKAFRPYALPVRAETIRRFLYLLRHQYAVDVTDPAAAAESIRSRIMKHAARG